MTHGSNGGPPLDDAELAFKRIDDIYEEAKHFADGEPIDSQDMADAISALHTALHDAGKIAEDLRVEAKRPLDEKIDAIQKRFNPYVQPKKGKVARGKDALADLLTAWRVKQNQIAAAKAEKARLEAEADRKRAEEAIRASAGNLEAREVAEELLETAKDADRFARRAEKAATTGTGLRTSWVAVMSNQDAALDWAYGADPARFTSLVQQMADEAVRRGARSIPGFEVKEEKRAA